jgi:hypothetical protein
LQELHTTVENFKSRDGDVIHAIQKELTFLKSVAEAVSRNAVGMATIARILKNVIMPLPTRKHRITPFNSWRIKYISPMFDEICVTTLVPPL